MFKLSYPLATDLFSSCCNMPIIREEELNVRDASPDYGGLGNGEEGLSNSSSNGSSMTFTTPEGLMFSMSSDSSCHSRYVDALEKSINMETMVTENKRDSNLSSNNELTEISEQLQTAVDIEQQATPVWEDDLISVPSSTDIQELLEQILEDDELREVQRKMEIKLGKQLLTENGNLHNNAGEELKFGQKTVKRKAATDLDLAVVPLKVLKSKETAMDYLFSLAQEIFASKAKTEEHTSEATVAGANSGVYRMSVDMAILESTEETIDNEMDIDREEILTGSGNDNTEIGTAEDKSRFAEVGPNQPPKPT